MSNAQVNAMFAALEERLSQQLRLDRDAIVGALAVGTSESRAGPSTPSIVLLPDDEPKAKPCGVGCPKYPSKLGGFLRGRDSSADV